MMTTRARILLLIILLGVIGVLVHRDVLYELAASVLRREDSSHGIFIPFISGYIIWQRQARLRPIKPVGSFLGGLAIIALGLILFMVRSGGLQPAIGSFSFLLVAAGLIIGLFGKDIMKELCFPLFFLVAMFPLPEELYAQLTEWMRITTTWGSVTLLKLIGFPIYRDGYNVNIPGLDLFVDESCSGIRYVIPYFVFGLAYAFLTRSGFTVRLLVVFATIPISILAGITRQACIFVSAYYIGPHMVDHTPHVMTSWAVFVTFLAAAIWIDRRISGIEDTH